MNYLLHFNNSEFNTLLEENLGAEVTVHSQSFDDLTTPLEKINYLCNELTGLTNELRFEIGIENIEQMCHALKHGEFVLKAFDTDTAVYSEVVYTPPKNGISNVFPPTKVDLVETETSEGIIGLLEERRALTEKMTDLNQQIKQHMNEGLGVFASTRISLSDLHEEWSTVVSKLLDQTVDLEEVDLESFGQYVTMVKQFSDKLHSLKS